MIVMYNFIHVHEIRKIHSLWKCKARVKFTRKVKISYNDTFIILESLFHHLLSDNGLPCHTSFHVGPVKILEWV